MPTCLDREKLTCLLGLSAPSTGNSAGLVEQCVQALGSLSCPDFLDSALPVQCTPAGPRADGSKCAFNGQCSSSYCNGDKTSMCGTCGAAPAAGSSCTASNCARGQVCANANMQCGPWGMSGAACSTTKLCGAGFACFGQTATVDGSCIVAATSTGTPCGGATNAACDPQLGHYCGGPTGSRICTPIDYVQAGTSCGTTGGAFVGCAGGGTCFTATGIATSGEAGTCKTPVREGTACDSALGPLCVPPARCVINGTGTTGTCTLPAGSSCG
jgi:hypothetical protein